MRFYSWLSDASLEPWLQVHKHRVVERYRQGVRWWNHVEIDGLCWVQTRICGDAVYVNIMGLDEFYFEFATSGNPVITDAFGAGTAYKYAIIAVKAKLAGSSFTVSPSISQDQRVKGDVRPLPSVIQRPQQVQLINEPVNEIPQAPVPKRGNYKRQLYESWAPMHAHTGVHTRSYNYGGGPEFDPLHSTRGPMGAEEARDIGYDVPWMDNTQKEPVRFAYLTGVTDYPRASGVQVVQSSLYGPREFAIYVDAFDQVSVFPTSQIKAQDFENQNVDPLYVTTTRVLFPSWCYVKAGQLSAHWTSFGDTGLVNLPELDWKLSGDGTRMCAIVYERSSADFDAAFFAASPGSNPFGATDFATYRDNATGYEPRQNTFADPFNLPQRYVSAPGLLEVTIGIVITGAAPENYNLTLTVREVRRPTTSPFCSFIAGYPWYDIANVDGSLAAAAGDLCVLDIEHYYQPSVAPTNYSTSSPYPFFLPDPATGSTMTIYSLKNLTTGLEINTFYGVRGVPLMDYDMTTLSFVFCFYVYSQVARTVNVRPGSPRPATASTNYTIGHPSAVVYTFNQLAEILYPETMDQVYKDAIAGFVASSPRAAVTGSDWTFMPLNDVRDWSSSTDLTHHRHDIAVQLHHITGSVLGTTSALKAWFGALQTYLSAYGLIYITKPQFGWYSYSDLIMNNLAKSPYSTFFVHPSGTWAFYDQSRIYNKFGMSFPSYDYDLYTPFDATQLEHVIFDRVHFAFPTHGSVDTSFMELYNTAQAASKNQDEPFLPMTLATLRAQFTKVQYVNPGDSVTWLGLQCDWNNGYRAYYMEAAYQGGAYINALYFGGGGLLDGTMDDHWYTSLGYAGTATQPQEDAYPITFSSCVLLSPS